MLDVEQQGLVSHEIFLLESLGKSSNAGELAETAAVSRLVAEGQIEEAGKLLRDFDHSHWSPASELLAATCSYHSFHKPRTPLHIQDAQGGAYWKELRLLQYVFEHAPAGCGLSICDAMDSFAEASWAATQQWSKIAGRLKAALLESSLRGTAAEVALLEMGTYCGYTSISLAAKFPEARIFTFEVDPMHVVIARNMIALSGLAQQLDVWTGHSRYLLPRLVEQHRHGKLQSFGAVLMDRWGTQYYEDFVVLDSSGLLSYGASIIADQVLWTGASLFLWDAARKKYSTRLVEVAVHDAAIDTDFLAIAVRDVRAIPGGQPNQTLAMKPPGEILRLHAEAEDFRERWIDGEAAGRLSYEQRERFASKMQAQCLKALPLLRCSNFNA